jgi:hypothetical protein
MGGATKLNLIALLLPAFARYKKQGFRFSEHYTMLAITNKFGLEYFYNV